MHRLDRSTSGLMCLAKTKEMAAFLGKSMSDIQKKYHCLSVSPSKISPQKGIISQWSEQPD